MAQFDASEPGGSSLGQAGFQLRFTAEFAEVVV
jgi:hypothetical protein